MTQTQSRIAILGTGLIGTSIGLALSKRPNRTYTLLGADRDRTNLRTAQKLGAIDKTVDSLEAAVEDSGFVIIAVPVLGARHMLKEMAPFLKPGTIVTDTCSTKSDIMKWADELLPEGVHFVGGHPMAGKEKSGPDAADAALFQNATWAITPSTRADEEAVRIMMGFVESMGAYPVYIDPAEHDQYVAAVSHLPILVSVALFRMARDSQGWEDASLLAGPAFRDLTRLASGDPTMAKDIIATNKDAILHWLDRFQNELENVKRAIEIGGEPVTDMLTSTNFDRDHFMMNPPQRRRPEGPEAPSAQDQIGRLFVGGLYDKLKDMSKLPEVRRNDAELKRKLGVRDDDAQG